MSIGIYTHYAHCDQAYFAVRLVDFLRTRGESFDIYSDNSPGKLKLPYDAVVKYKKICSFTDWARHRSTIVWTHVPRVEQIDYCRRKGIRTILVPMWQELVPPFKKAMKHADHVVAMNRDSQELYSDIYRINHLVTIPFDTGLPLTRKETRVDPRNVKLFLPWFDRNARCSSSQFLGLLGFILERMHEAHLTVSFNSSRFGPAVAKFFARLGKRCDGRVQLVRSVPLVKRPALYANADLTIWPGECDNYGLVGLTSLACGTPVLTLAAAPQSDYLHQDVNAALVKTRIDYDDNGVSHAVPNYEKFAAAMQDLIAEPYHIDAMQKKVSYNLAARRSAFESGWRGLLNLS
jgi:hypothetical protein